MTVHSSTYHGDYFALQLSVGAAESEMVMEMQDERFSTKMLPHTWSILHRELPGVLETNCYNPAGLPFTERVKDTMVGHMLEHVMLEFLADMKARLKGGNVDYKGVTSWDWRVNKKGTFEIVIGAGWEDVELVLAAWGKTITLVETIFKDNELVH